MVDDVYLGGFLIPDNAPLGAGLSFTGEVNWTAVAGRHTITAVADDLNRFTESNESDNNKKFTVDVESSLPNLIVTSITTTPATPTVGTPTVINVTIKNIGTASTPSDVLVGTKVMVDDVYLGGFLIQNDASNNLGRLDAGATFTGQCNVNWTAVAGNHTFKAVADDVNRFVESNESDNTMSTPVNVASLLPNLVVDSITTIPATPTVGTPTIIKVTIRNNGAARTPDNTYVGVAVLVDGTNLGGFLIPNDASNNLGRLDAGATFTGQCNVNWTAVAGNHTFKAVADDVNRFVESNESDNTMSTPVNVASLP